MKTSVATVSASIILLSSLAFAQPQVENPAEPRVPGVGEPGVRNPEPPPVPNTTGPGLDGMPSDSSTYGACPATQCANGEVPASEADCPDGQAAVCSCDGFCDSDGNPQGLNRCACE